MVTKEQQQLALGDALYERLAKPLEADDAAFTERPFIFTLGEKAVGRWHRPLA